MAIRVALLILVTGAFVALWSGDCPEQVAAVHRRNPDQIRRLTPEPATETLSRTKQTNQSTRSVTLSHADAPLPDGIVAGTYLVADQFGRTHVRVVSSSPRILAWDKSANPADHYSLEWNGVRLHYIRIQSTIEDRTAIVPRLKLIRK